MLVGVCMLVYNHEKFVKQAVESIIQQQTNFSFKLVIGEDCSSDASREILKTLQQKYPEKIELLLNEKNLGMINNFNRTIKAIDAKYIAFCEGDDYWNATDKLQQQVDLLEANPTVGLTFSNFSIKEKNRIISRAIKTDPGYGLHPENLFVNNSIATCTVMCRQVLLRKAQEFLGDHNFHMGDYPLWLYIAQKSKLAFIDKPMATYRIVGGSATNQNVEKQLNFLESQHDLKQLYSHNFPYPEAILRNAEIQYLKKKLLLCFLTNRKIDLKESCEKLNLLNEKLTLRERLYCNAVKSQLLSWPLRQYHVIYHMIRRH